MLRESGALPRTPRGPSAPRPHLRTQAVNCPLKRGSSMLGMKVRPNAVNRYGVPRSIRDSTDSGG